MFFDVRYEQPPLMQNPCRVNKSYDAVDKYYQMADIIAFILCN
jgi:hypothetical protein